MGEKPLHVLVAEALGWTDILPLMVGSRISSKGSYTGIPPWIKVASRKAREVYRSRLPRYDVETERNDYECNDDGWAATGPLIERFEIFVTPYCQFDSAWAAHVHETKWRHVTSFGVTPLVAICNLILALNAAGKRDLADAIGNVESSQEAS